jgi:acyl CoA:acetate/3-ketoacid CoA transferase alpha subunit/acyl CoA:acetate/3-ketoacid CoA transferase beta subunit
MAVVGQSLEEAICRNVSAGDVVQVVCGHSRWTCLAREMARQFWGSDAGITLVMTSLGSMGALFVAGRVVSRVVTAYSGDTFPTYSPNPVLQRAYESGRVEVEHWSILTLTQRLEAAARGLPAAVTGSLAGSSMAENEAFVQLDSPYGPVGLLRPLMPDVALLHAAVADRAGNLAMSEPLLEGIWGAWAARRGVVASVEAVVDSLEGLGYRVKVPAHRVLSVVHAPFGAHPGGCSAPGLPCESYGEDITFFTEAARAARTGLEDFARKWVIEPESHDSYLSLLGEERLSWLRQRSDPNSWLEDNESHPVPVDEPVSDWETAAALAAREVESVVRSIGADGVLAGAGVANLAAWVAVGRCRIAGIDVHLTAELGLWGYTPTPADPYIFNHRVFPRTLQLSDSLTVLGMVVGGPGTRVVGCLGAAQVDVAGNINSTELRSAGRRRFLVGSGGANDVASRADAVVVVTVARNGRIVEAVDYVTGPGHRVVAVVTDLGILRRQDGTMRLAAVPAGKGSVQERATAFIRQIGLQVDVCRELEELSPVSLAEVKALRDFDRERQFLS